MCMKLVPHRKRLWASMAIYGDGFIFLYADDVYSSQKTHLWSFTACILSNQCCDVIFNGLSGRCLNLAIYIHLLSRSRIVEPYIHSLIRFYGSVLIFYLTTVQAQKLEFSFPQVVSCCGGCISLLVHGFITKCTGSCN
jgi:hypothetical protein